VLPCDLRDRAQVAGLVPQAEAAMGQLDILVNNAGVTKDNLFMRMKDEEWDEVIAINLTSIFILCRSALRNMMRREKTLDLLLARAQLEEGAQAAGAPGSGGEGGSAEGGESSGGAEQGETN